MLAIENTQPITARTPEKLAALQNIHNKIHEHAPMPPTPITLNKKIAPTKTFSIAYRSLKLSRVCC